MKQINNGKQHIADPPEVKRTAFLVEEEDVGSTIGQYLGQFDYTFEPKDVGRLLEVVQEMSPGFVSWNFGSLFTELRQQYPNPFPYVKVE